jgi:hypothetical protein
VRIWIAVVVGVVVVTAAAAAVGGRDHTGDTVRASTWADDVCGSVGAWEGQLEDIGDELKLSNVGARRNDGGSGDQVEGTVYVRGAIDRAIQATDQTLQEGLKRSGNPDVGAGERASLILRTWAQQTENGLRVVEDRLDHKPNTTSAAFASLGASVAVLERSAVQGRAAFRRVSGLDSQLADALDGSRNCRDLMKDQP